MEHYGKKNGVSKRVPCMVCLKDKRRSEVESVALLRPNLVELLRQRYPERWTPNGYVCLNDIQSLRIDAIDDVLRMDRKDISVIEEDVILAVKEHLTLTRNLNTDFENESTFGGWLADKIASFGGSWKFIGLFCSVIMFWIGVNVMPILSQSFDPYPFILLNLFLSTLTSFQAPLIMMSQNRQAAKDRLKAENEYRVSLKNELQIRLLTDKLDHLMGEQWQRLLEIQQALNDNLNDLSDKVKRSGDV